MEVRLAGFPFSIPKKSIFDEGLESRERLIPLLGNAIQEILHFLQRLATELELAFAAGADAANNSNAFQDTKMFGDGLAGELRATR